MKNGLVISDTGPIFSYKKARNIAESLGIQCIGTIGLLSNAREKGFISELRPLFEAFLKNKRYYSLDLLNSILRVHQEDEIK
jgi:predicted nucleic acid-binding protein